MYSTQVNADTRLNIIYDNMLNSSRVMPLNCVLYPPHARLPWRRDRWHDKTVSGVISSDKRAEKAPQKLRRRAPFLSAFVQMVQNYITTFGIFLEGDCLTMAEKIRGRMLSRGFGRVLPFKGENLKIKMHTLRARGVGYQRFLSGAPWPRDRCCSPPNPILCMAGGDRENDGRTGGRVVHVLPPDGWAEGFGGGWSVLLARTCISVGPTTEMEGGGGGDSVTCMTGADNSFGSAPKICQKI